MITLNELRFGNRFNFKNPMDGKLYPTTFSILDDYLDFEAYAEPIPLTHDILVKCGFEFNKIEGVTGLDESDPEATTYYWDLRVKRNDVYDGEGTLSLVQWGDNKPIYFSNQWLRVKMIHLHQLQNLIFALTNQELDIKF